ncbi:MAG: glycosyltransferase family 2 protein [Candidatus Omnitrophica bacterium]|nr:glycosyltransferase family 2 protein [Candidatus Omnitrophota bacterium]
MKAQPLLSVVIPIYNEERTIERLFERVDRVPIRKEIILIDDGSTDRTREIIMRQLLPGTRRVKLVSHPTNLGKGSAIRTGLKEVAGDIVLIQDADLEYAPEEYPRLVAPILADEAEVVFGTRYCDLNKWRFVWRWLVNRMTGQCDEIRYLHHFLGIQILNAMVCILYQARLTDEATCYKVFKTEFIRSLDLKCRGFEFCPEVTAKIRKKGIRIHEVPITYHPRSHKEGKKLNWKHGFEAVWTLIKYRFVD